MFVSLTQKLDLQSYLFMFGAADSFCVLFVWQKILYSVQAFRNINKEWVKKTQAQPKCSQCYGKCPLTKLDNLLENYS